MYGHSAESESSPRSSSQLALSPLRSLTPEVLQCYGHARGDSGQPKEAEEAAARNGQTTFDAPAWEARQPSGLRFSFSQVALPVAAPLRCYAFVQKEHCSGLLTEIMIIMMCEVYSLCARVDFYAGSG